MDPTYGKVYHTGNAEDVQKMLDAEGAYWYHAHPRTKGTTGYPGYDLRQALREERSLPGRRLQARHGSGQLRTADVRVALLRRRRHDEQPATPAPACAPKYIIADIDTYRKGPEDDIYANFPVNYLRIDKVPGPDEDFTPILKALRDGNFFVTTGEILIKDYTRRRHRAISGRSRRTSSGPIRWRSWRSSGATARRSTARSSRRPISRAFGTKHFAIPFNATGKAWVRFAVWDSAGNGAFVQPIWLKAPPTTNTRAQ